MLHTVEIRIVDGDLPAAMSRMRIWLDHRRIETDVFRSVGSPATTFRLEFKSEDEAEAFADAFGGRLLRSA